jgi:hypothetical protein
VYINGLQYEKSEKRLSGTNIPPFLRPSGRNEQLYLFNEYSAELNLYSVLQMQKLLEEVILPVSRYRNRLAVIHNHMTGITSHVFTNLIHVHQV